MSSLNNRLRVLEASWASRATSPSGDLSRYALDPVGYCRDILHVTLTPDQERIAVAFLVHPFKVKVRAGHNVGKTFLFACLANWWYDTRPESVVITTAPTYENVVRLLWTEIRLQRHRAKLPMDFIGPSAPEMKTGPDHWAMGLTAAKGEHFQGRHRANMLFLFDEDEGLDQSYYQRTKTMFKAGDGHAWGSIGNPYTTSSASCFEESQHDKDGNPAWNLFSLSCLTHPNVLAELAEKPPPVPNAVNLAQVENAVAEECERLGRSEKRPGEEGFPFKHTDIEWPPESGEWYRPGPVFEAAVLGRRPTTGTNAVWSEAVFDFACGELAAVHPDMIPEMGCDVARYGDDWTAIHTRIGPNSLAHESANGWGVDQTSGRLIELAREWADTFSASRPDRVALKPQEIKIKVDDDGVGGGVSDVLRSQGYNATPVSAASRPNDPNRFPKRRDELWFDVARRAAAGLVRLRAIPLKLRQRIRVQALGPIYQVDHAGRRQVEPKDKTKERINRSPDDMDAVNLAYAECGDDVPRAVAGHTRSKR